MSWTISPLRSDRQVGVDLKKSSHVQTHHLACLWKKRCLQKFSWCPCGLVGARNVVTGVCFDDHILYLGGVHTAFTGEFFWFLQHIVAHKFCMWGSTKCSVFSSKCSFLPGMFAWGSGILFSQICPSSHNICSYHYYKHLGRFFLYLGTTDMLDLNSLSLSQGLRLTPQTRQQLKRWVVLLEIPNRVQVCLTTCQILAFSEWCWRIRWKCLASSWSGWVGVG